MPDTSYDITMMESNVSRRIIYFSILSRTQTGIPVTTMAGSVCSIHKGGAAALASAATLLARDATNGLYSLTMAQSECSVMNAPGTMAIMVSNASCMPTTAFINIRAVDSGDSMRFGLFALPNAAANASGGLPQKGTTHSDFTVRVEGVDYSGLTVQGVKRVDSSVTIANALYSAVTIRVDPQDYSGLTVGVGRIAPNTYSGVTIAGVQKLLSAVTLAAGTYSDVTIGGVNKILSAVTLAAGTYSDVTIGGVNKVMSAVSLAAGKYSDVTVQVENQTVVDTAAIADKLLGRSIGGGADGPRTVTQALQTLRNRVLLEGSTMTIFSQDDTTSSWTASVTTTADPFHLNQIDPIGT